jgi:GNAT superfamily N-acetyltransferase
MELVEATADDLDTLVDRWYSLAKSIESYDELNELVYTDADEVSRDGFCSHLESEESAYYLIVHENETIGYVLIEEGHHPSRQYSSYFRLVDLHIDEDRRNRGHGTAVVERVKQMARDRGCDYLKVSCEWQNEDARRFYRETGFRPKQVEYAHTLS